MSKLSHKFTQDFVFTAAQPLSVREITYTASCTQGLTLRVLSSGQRSYYSRLWNSRTKRILRVKLGDAELISIKQAKAAVFRLRQELAAERINGPEQTVQCLSDAYQSFMEDLVSRRVSESYHRQNALAWKRVPSRLRKLELREITHSDLSLLIRNLYAELPGTAYSLRRLLRGIFRLAIINRRCTYDPSVSLPFTPIKARREVLSDADLSVLISIVRKDAKRHPARSCLFLLLAATGQRTNEVRTLLWSDVRSDRIEFRAEHRKNKQSHTVYRNALADEALSLLDRGIGNKPVFPKGGRAWMAAYGTRLQERTGIRFTMHMLRKTLISRLLAQGTPVHIVAGISGHTDVATLMKHYAVSRDDELQAAVKALRF